jgi:hypothetical protein
MEVAVGGQCMLTAVFAVISACNQRKADEMAETKVCGKATR